MRDNMKRWLQEIPELATHPVFAKGQYYQRFPLTLALMERGLFSSHSGRFELIRKNID